MNIQKCYVEESKGAVGRNSSPRRRMISDHATADTLVRPPGANCAMLNGSSVERTRILALFARSILATPTIASRNSLGKGQKSIARTKLKIRRNRQPKINRKLDLLSTHKIYLDFFRNGH